MSATIQKGHNKVNDILKDLFHYYRQRDLTLFHLLFKRGSSYKEIAEALDVSPLALKNHYPKKEIYKKEVK